jgi:NitT/TauT family transport system ATP-binding protein
MSGVSLPDAGTLEGFSGQTISYLFQETRLLPWKTVKQNVEFVLKDKLSWGQRTRIISETLEMVELSNFADYYPAQLSGGMKQRVAIARAFAYPSALLLMDEPFDGLDHQLKWTVMEAFLKLWQQERRSVFFVTHDINEALFLGEEIYVLTDRPACVKGKISNPVPHQKRDLTNESTRNIEKQLYTLIADVTGRKYL